MENICKLEFGEMIPKMICCLWQHDMPCDARHDIQPLTRLYDMIFAFAIITRAANIMRVSVYHDEVISFADRRISLRVVAPRQLAKSPFCRSGKVELVVRCPPGDPMKFPGENNLSNDCGAKRRL